MIQFGSTINNGHSYSLFSFGFWVADENDKKHSKAINKSLFFVTPREDHIYSFFYSPPTMATIINTWTASVVLRKGQKKSSLKGWVFV